jgi:hypothetical protein
MVMSTITFDTHAFVKRLTSSGLSEQQAEAIAEAQKDSLSQALTTTFATKSDIQRIEADVMLLKWMTGTTLALCVTILARLFFK